uniref:Uncharacterized protein n=1 Tax=Anopheles maculatus TaxID=74869 RepID=A0A182SBX7_9DIPT
MKARRASLESQIPTNVIPVQQQQLRCSDIGAHASNGGPLGSLVLSVDDEEDDDGTVATASQGRLEQHHQDHAKRARLNIDDGTTTSTATTTTTPMNAIIGPDC